jgi:hypothetical protein
VLGRAARVAANQCVEPDTSVTEIVSNASSFTLEVDGKVFAIGPDKRDGTDYTWLSGPNPGYGFALSPTPDLSLDEHRENVREFLADIDPTTGYLRED